MIVENKIPEKTTIDPRRTVIIRIRDPLTDRYSEPELETLLATINP
jgi:uncharacterized protein YmfQ (DUF2313 family)